MEVTDCRGKIAGEPDARYISHPVDAAADCSPEAALHTRCFALSPSGLNLSARLHSLSRVIRRSRGTERERERVRGGPALSSGSHISRDLVEKPCTVRGVCAYIPFVCI